eukprot:GFUD01047564.1.p1 GENE.GFUD01047564.1~~GFUD01047564.1.p1  ORF type:complete len:427 (-),score=76.54 GFUD01047564.1:62-1342(-)
MITIHAIFCVLLASTSVVILLLKDSSSQYLSLKVHTKPTDNIPDTSMKTILLWTPWFRQFNYRLGELGDSSWLIADLGFDWEGHKHTDLRDFGCDQESYKCTITSNRSYLEDESLYDGFMFHQVDINQADIPDQSKRKTSQVYMFHTMESPLHSLRFDPNGLKYDPSINNNFFNVTTSYHSHSQIHLPYGNFVKTAEHPTGSKLDKYISQYGKENARFMTAKNLSATVLLSNCRSFSDREGVLNELGKLMLVDVFGNCGKPPPKSFMDDGKWGGPEDSHTLLSKTYPFYLAFENSLCEDYVSEKFFSSLHTDMIPVVYNWANMSRIAPKHSYIDVKDFATIRELADYLKKVNSEPALYASYFWWRQFYQLEYFRDFTRSFVKIFCEACRHLHHGKRPSMVKDLHKEWMEGQCTQPPIISSLDQKAY